MKTTLLLLLLSFQTALLAVPLVGTGNLINSTVNVDLLLNASVIGSSKDVSLPSGTLEIEVAEATGSFTSLNILSGAFTVADTTITFPNPLLLSITSSLSSSGLGFSVDSSSFTLLSLGGNEYQIIGNLNLTADTGDASTNPPLFSVDFETAHSPFIAALLDTSRVTITEEGSTGEYTIVGALRFASTELASDTVPELGTVAIRVSSVDTINFSGVLVPIPEPSTLGLLLAAFLGLWALRFIRK